MSQRVHTEPELSVVVAVGDQEDSIGHLIRNVAAHLSSLGRTFELLIVNAGCSDNSLSIAHGDDHGQLGLGMNALRQGGASRWIV